MKTTVDIADSLLAAARRLAGKERTTVRALIEEGKKAASEAKAAELLGNTVATTETAAPETKDT